MRFKLLLFFFISVNSLIAQHYTISTNHDDANFKVGEKIKFKIKSNIKTDVTYTISWGKHADVLKTGELELKKNQTKTISYTPTEPGAVHIIVRNNWSSAEAGAIVGIHDIKVAGDEPDDFDSFWQGVKNELQNVPMNPKLNSNASTAYSKSYRVKLGNIDNRHVYGMLHVPIGDGPFPAVVELPAYGDGQIFGNYELAERTNCLILAISIHDAPVNSHDNNAYEPDDPRDRDLNYHKHSVTAGIRAIDYLTSRDDFNGSDVALIGESQGAGLAMLIAGIDGRVDLMGIASTALSNHAGLNEGHASGFSYYLNIPMLVGDNEAIEDLLDNMPYYDAGLAAKRYDGYTLLQTTYDDFVTGAETQFAGSNNLTGKKVIIHNLTGGHDERPGLRTGQFGMLRRYFDDANNPPFPWADDYVGYGVDAGNDKSGGVNQSIALAGKIEKELVENPNIPIQWRKVSGPGNVNFSNDDAYETNASFNQQGTYILEFQGTDFEQLDDEGYYFTISDRIKITIGNGGGGEPDEIDLELAMVADHTSVTKNSPISFSLTLSNKGETKANNIKTKFKLPQGLDFISYFSNAGQYNAATGYWSLDKLNVNASKTLTVVASLDSQTPVVAYAQVTQVNESDVDSYPNNNSGPIPNEDDEAAITVSNTGSPNESCTEISGFSKLGELAGHGYYLSYNKLDWQKAKNVAASHNGYLTSITTMQENDFLEGHLNAAHEIAYIGFHDSNNEGQEEWANNEPVTLDLSTKNSGSKDFAVMNFWNGEWEMVHKSVSKRYILEKSCGVASGTLSINCSDDIMITTNNSSVAVTWNTPSTNTTCSAGSIVNLEQISNYTSGSFFSVGSFEISYKATDLCGNEAICSFTVTVNQGSSGGACADIEGFTMLGEYNGHGYYKSYQKMNWQKAYDYAHTKGLYLTSISSQEENDYILSKIGDDQVLIGLNDAENEGHEQWANDESVDFDLSFHNSDSRDYALMNFWNGAWEMQKGSVAKRFVAEKSCSGGTGSLWISCPDDINVIANSSNTATVSWVAAIAGSSCSIGQSTNVNQVTNWTSGGSFDIGNYEVTYEANDLCGNTKTCSFEIKVTGSCPPMSGFQELGEFGNHSYYKSFQKMNWNEANVYSKSLGAYLTTINSQEENDFVQSKIGNDQVFIGLNDANNEGHEQWSNGEEVTIDLSFHNSGSRDYALMNFWNGAWEMQNNQVSKRFVIEKYCGSSSKAFISAAPNNSTAIFPNPAKAFTTVHFENKADEEIKFTILNIHGQVQFVAKSIMPKGKNQYTLNVSELPAGNYLVLAQGEQTYLIWKFVK